MDSDLQEVIHLTLYGWSRKEHRLKRGFKPYFTQESNTKILYFHDQIAIPQSPRAGMLQSTHTGHLGLNKCRERGKMSVWWPKIFQEIDFIKRCEFYNCHRAANHNECFKPNLLPDRPRQKVGTDILKLDEGYYLVVRDYFSPFLEIVTLSPLTSNTIIGKLKSLFAQLVILYEIVIDNAEQDKHTFKRICEKIWIHMHKSESSFSTGKWSCRKC